MITIEGIIRIICAQDFTASWGGTNLYSEKYKDIDG